MKIQYITADLEFKSNEDLNSLVQEICEVNHPHLNEWVGNIYHVVLGGAGIESTPEATANSFCNLIENLSPNLKKLWVTSFDKILDIAFESGKVPNSITYHLPIDIIQRLSELDIGIAITIYPIGAYSYENKET